MIGYSLEWIDTPWMIPAQMDWPETPNRPKRYFPLVNIDTVRSTGRITTRLSAEPLVQILMARGLYIHQIQSMKYGLWHILRTFVVGVSVIVFFDPTSEDLFFLLSLRSDTMMSPQSASAIQNRIRPKYFVSSHQINGPSCDTSGACSDHLPGCASNAAKKGV